MVIKFNNEEIYGTSDLQDMLKKNQDNYEILVIESETEWIQFLCEDSIVAVSLRAKNKTSYYHNLKKQYLMKTIISYCKNPKTFIFKEEFLDKNKKTFSTKTLKTISILLFICISLNLVQILSILKSSTVQGNYMKKIFSYYFNDSITPYQKSLPFVTVSIFVLWTVCIIKYKKTRKQKI